MSASMTSSNQPPYGRSVECSATAPPGSTRTRPPKPEVSPLPLTPKAPLRKPPLGAFAPSSASSRPLRSPGPVIAASPSSPSSPRVPEALRPLLGEQHGVAVALLDEELAGAALGGRLLVGLAQLLVGAHGRGHLDHQVLGGALLLLARQLPRALGTERLLPALVVQLEDRVGEHLRPRRAAGQVHVHRDDVVDALHDRVVVEHAAGAGAHA